MNGFQMMLGVNIALFFCYYPICCLRMFSFSFSLPRRSSDSGSLSRFCSPVPTAEHAFIFIARRRQPFLPPCDSRRIVLTHAIQRSRQLVSREM